MIKVYGTMNGCFIYKVKKKKKSLKHLQPFSDVVLVSSTWSFFFMFSFREKLYLNNIFIHISFSLKTKNCFMCSSHHKFMILLVFLSIFWYNIKSSLEKKALFKKIVLKVLFYLPSKSVKNYHNYNREFGKTFMFYYVFLSYEWIYLCV